MPDGTDERDVPWLPEPRDGPDVTGCGYSDVGLLVVHGPSPTGRFPSQEPGTAQTRTRGTDVTLLNGDPRRIGTYRLESRLGAGGMGVVYRARSATGRTVALKVILPELAEGADFRARFAREVESARKVSGAFTAAVVEADAEAETPWLATVWISGPSLAQHIGREGPLDASGVRLLAGGLVEALRDIHRADLVHRDLKPANILLADDGPRVIDFGIAHVFEATRLTGTGIAVGTAPYMAPEQFLRDREVAASSDVFSLGSVLVFAATGHGPFDGDNGHVIGYRVVHEEPDLSGLPPELASLVVPCLAKEPHRRPTVGELFASLTELDHATDRPSRGGPVGRATEAPVSVAAPAAEPGRPRTDVTSAPVPGPGFGPPQPPPSLPSAGAPAGLPPGGARPPAAPSTVPGEQPAGRRKIPAAVTAVLAVLAAAAAIAVPYVLLKDGGAEDDPAKPGGSGTPTGSAVRADCASGTLEAAGSPAEGPAMDSWAKGLADACPGAQLNWTPSGAGAGLDAFARKSARLAIVHGSLTRAQTSLVTPACAADGSPLHLPLNAMPLAVAYTLGGVDDLVLDAETLGLLFQGEITRWDDPRIAALNKGTVLPARAVRLLAPGGDSSSTHAFTRYLSDAGDSWPYEPGSRLPSATAGKVTGVNGGDALAREAQATDGSLTYLPLDQVPDGSLDTARLATSGAPVAASGKTGTETLAGARLTGTGSDLRLTPDLGAPGQYPLLQIGYAIVCDKGTDTAALPLLRAFLTHAVSPEGRGQAESAGYSALPEALAARVGEVARDLG